MKIRSVFLLILLISLPVFPVLAQLSTIGCVDTEAAYGVYVYDNYAYVADYEAGLQIIDVSNPAEPTILFTFDTDNFTAYDVETNGYYAYVADYNGYLRVINVFNPVEPYEVEELRYQFDSAALSVRLYGRYLYVGTESDGFYIFDIADPLQMHLEAQYNQGGENYSAYILGSRGYFSDGTRGMSIMDLDCVFQQGVPPNPVNPDPGNPSDDELDCHDYCSGPTEFTLWAGQNVNAGYVRVWQEQGQNKLYVKFRTNDGWRFNETHVEIAEALDDIPQANGNPIPGQFRYHLQHNNRYQFTYAIDLDNNEMGINAFIACHASLVRNQQEESGWAGENEFPGNNWAVYFNYETSCCNGNCGGGGDDDDDDDDGDEYAQDIDVLPDYDFGPVDLGENEVGAVVIHNVGTSDLTVYSALVTGTCYAGQLFENVVIPPNQTAEVVITFTPDTEGTCNGTLTITSDDPDEQQVLVNLTGVGVITPAPEIQVLPTVIDYGELFIGTSATEDLVITNIGNAALDITGISIAGTGFSAPNQPPLTLQPGESHTVTITFAADVVQSYSGSVAINSNDDDEAVVTVPLYGSGITTDCEISVFNPFFEDAITYDVEISGNYVFVANGLRGLYILEISDPAMPDSIGSVQTGGVVYDVEAIGRYIMMAEGPSGLRIYDASNLNDLQFVEAYEVNGGIVRDIFIRGSQAFIAMQSGGMCILDIDDYVCCEPVPYEYHGGWWLMSVPVVPNNPEPGANFGDDIPPPASWAMYSFNYTSGMYPVYPEIPPFPSVLELGRGYWLGIANAIPQISLDLEGEPFEGDFTWDLEYPWNMIGCPFQHDVWLGHATFEYYGYTYTAEEAAYAGLIVPCLHTSQPDYGWWGYYNGFASTTNFEPWKGYWFLVLVDGLQMTLPGTAGGQGGAHPDQILPRSELDDGYDRDWNLALSFTADDTVYSVNTLGSNMLAQDGFDVWFDYGEPPVSDQYSALHAYFPHEDWEMGDIPRFLNDIRDPLDDEQQDWNISMEVLRMAQVSEVTIGWPRIADTVPDGYQFSLIDNASGTTIDMLQQSSYTFPVDQNRYTFTIQVTAGALSVRDNQDELASDFQVSSAYPNPFNPTTTISFTLPEVSRVVVKVYDINGRLVAEPINSLRMAGEHSMIWDAGNLASGVYLVQFRAGDYKTVQKVVLTK